MPQKGFSKTPHQKLRFGTGQVWLLVVVVAVVIAAGVLVWWRLQKPVGEVVAPQAPQEEGQPPADETTDWQTYRNEEYGFEVEYPRMWPLPQQLAFHSEDYRWQEMGKVVRRGEITAGVKVDISFAKIPENIGWREWVTLGRGAVGNVISYGFTTIGGREVFRIVMDGSKAEGITGRNYIEVRFPGLTQEQEVIFILYSLTEDRGENEKIFNQMLSTFQFLDPVRN